jgi:ABC-2 type transport system ATP-binding protein
VAPGDPTGFSHELNEQGVFKAQWTSLFFVAGNATTVGGVPPSGQPQGDCPAYKLASGDPTLVAGTPCLGYLAELCQIYARVVATGEASAQDRALLDRASAATFMDTLVARRLPVLLVQGQRDTLFNPNDALAAYTRLQAAGVPVTMVWNWGGRGGYNSRPGSARSTAAAPAPPPPAPPARGSRTAT